MTLSVIGPGNVLTYEPARRSVLRMTTSRYQARSEGNRIIAVDSLSENHAVYEFTDEQGQAIVDAAQRFLDAGIARYGSLEAFDRACRWMLGAERLA